MTEPFTASNGVTVKEVGAGLYVEGDGVRLDRLREKLQAGSYGDVTPAMQVALREFFQHERDEELGRWRWPENPEYVAYRRDAYPGDKRRVRVIHEPDGDFVDTVEGSILDGIFKDAARAYFESHPERKPWEDAKDGEIWEFTLGCSSGQYLADGGRFFLLPLRAPSDPGWKPASFASNFETGERIWPEDAS